MKDFFVTNELNQRIFAFAESIPYILAVT